MQPRRHRMRKPARLASARDWVRSGALVTVGTYARRYGVDRYTAYDELPPLGRYLVRLNLLAEGSHAPLLEPVT